MSAGDDDTSEVDHSPIAGTSTGDNEAARGGPAVETDRSDPPLGADHGAEGAAAPKPRRTRRTVLFPAVTFADALPLAEAIEKYGAGKPVRRLTLFESLDKSPDSGPTRQLMTNSSRYGLTKGGHTSEFLELTDKGRLAVSEDTPPRARLQSRFDLAIAGIDIFRMLYDAFVGNRLPAPNVLIDHATQAGIPATDAAACVETFTINVKDLGLLRTVGGAERLFPVEAVIEELEPAQARGGSVRAYGASDGMAAGERPHSGGASTGDFDKACFYISPIGDEGTEARKHSDLFMGSLIEPSLDEFGLHLVRADQITDAGMITAQVIEHIVRSKLVIVDLSFHNPNVFYELALRHAVRKPIVQLSRAQDRLPFDVSQFRTVVIDTTDVYTFVPRIDSIKAEIAGQIRKSLEQSHEAENPLSLFFPSFWDHLPRTQSG